METRNHSSKEPEAALRFSSFFRHYLLRSYFFALRLGIQLATFRGKLTYYLRVYIKRPEWIYFPHINLEPVKKFTIAPHADPSDDDIQLCKRLITAYQLAVKGNPPFQTASGLWKDLIKNYQDPLPALMSGNPESVAKALAEMFQSDILYGISSGAFGLNRGMAPFIRMKTTEELLALAESLGVVRAETPEQGEIGYELAGGLERLVQKIEDRLGVSIDFPRVGGAYGIQVGKTLLTPESPEHIYVAGRISEAVRQHVQTAQQEPLRLVEIGAGFGGTAHWIIRLGRLKIANYTIVDLPLVNVCQGYFLAKVLGAEKVRLYGEDTNPAQLISIIPPHAKDEIVTQNFHVLINENSMPEIPEQVVKDYLIWAKTKLTDIFYSYNQEAFSPVNGVPQTLVPKAASEVGGFRLLSRNYSWLRRGYVEEIYSVRQ